MTRQTADQARGRIPNMQAQAVPAQVRPASIEENTRTEVGGSSTPRDVGDIDEMGRGSSSVVLGGPSHCTGSVVTGYHADDPDVPKARYYRVVKEHTYRAPGQPRTQTLAEGRVVSDASFDVRGAKQQGVRFEECDADGEPLPVKQETKKEQ